MISLNQICRLCLINTESDCKKLLIELTDIQKKKFEELTDLELPLTDQYPSNVCTDCSDHLENFHFFKNQLIRKQNDLNLFLRSTITSESQQQDGLLQQTILDDDIIQFDEEIEIFDENNELLSNSQNIEDDKFITEQLLPDEENKIKPKSTIVCREELKFEKPRPQLILTPKFLYARDVIKNPEQITLELESPIIDAGDKVNFKCTECNISFLSNGELQLHLKDHVLIADFKCTVCNIYFKNEHSYQKHFLENHNQGFICQTCGNVYDNKRNLRSHLRSHNFNKKYKCTHDGCEKSFRHQHHLINHLRVHTKNSPFVCDVCNQTFRQKYALTLHKKKHEKDFILCSKCNSEFIRPIQLKKHLENNLCDGTFKPYIIRTKKNKVY